MKRDNSRFTVAFCLVLFLLFSASSLAQIIEVNGVDTSTEGALSYEDILRGNYVSIDRVQEHVRFFTLNSTPRFTGYPGFYRAQEYIYNKFNEYGLRNVTYQWYNVTVPMDLGGELDVYHPNGTLLKTYPVQHLWPNSVQVSSTPPGGFTGRLFYAKGGDYADYTGHDVNGSVVLLNFNSSYNWQNAMDLGAKAVVFIEPEVTSNLQSINKHLPMTPIYAPRVYLRKEYAKELLGLLSQYGGELDVRLESSMEWQLKRVANVVGFSPGTGSLKDQWIIFVAHFDAWSVVPSLTEGATDACGIASLLELIRIYSHLEHGRSIMFVAVSGYGQGLYGARYFVDGLLVGDSFPEVLPRDSSPGKGVFFFLGIDLSPESSSVGPLAGSDFYTLSSGGISSTKGEQFVIPFFYSVSSGAKTKILDAWRLVYGRTWTIANFEALGMYNIAYFPTSFFVDADAFYGNDVASGTGRITFRTIYAWLDRRYTPLDTLSRLEDLNNLKPQIEFALCSSYDLSYVTKNVKPEYVRTYSSLHWEGWNGPQFYRVTGQVVTYDEFTAQYKPLPNAIIQLHNWGTWGNIPANLAMWFETTDEKGYFTSYVIPGNIGGSGHFEFYPYVINKTTSQIEYAPDFGRFGSGRFPHRVQLVGGQKNPFYGSESSPLTFVGFKCGTIQIFGIDAPEGTSVIQLSAGWGQYAGAFGVAGSFPSQLNIVVNEPASHSQLGSYGYEQEMVGAYNTDPSRSVTIFVIGNTPTEMILSYTGQLSPLGLFHNARAENPLDGYGYRVGYGETLTILHSTLSAAKELNYLNRDRLKGMEARNIYTTGLSYVREANDKIESAEEALRNLDYGSYYSNAVSALAIERESYNIVKTDLYSVLSSTLTLFVTILLFAYLAERLFFSSIQLRNRALGIALFTALALAPLILLHPGFTIASNVYVAMYGIVVLVFIGMVWVLLFGYSLSSFRRLREKIIGKHFIEVSRITSLMTGMGLGLQYMKKRRLRASLTLTTLVIVSASIVMFTSVTNISFIKPSSTTRNIAYTGVFIREYQWNPVNPRLLDYLGAKLGAENILPRAWLFARLPIKQYGFIVGGPNGTDTVLACYGLTSREGTQVGWTNYLKAGIWFEKEDYDWVILSEALAQKIGAKPGDAITVMGASLKVKGILYDAVINIRKLDGALDSIRDPGGPPGQDMFVPPRDMVYVPFRWAVDHSGKIHEIIVLGSDPQELALELAKEINLDFYVANKIGTVPVEFYSRRTGFMVSGYEFAILPLALAALTVLNLMLGAVYERIKEIAVFSTVGLSPRDVGMMFLSESISYGVIGVILGYISGIVGLSILLAYNALPPGIYPNYSSGFIVQTVGIIILVVVLSSLFPFLKSAKLVTPSLERKWKITTKPLGDQWDIPTPFNFSSEQEAEGFVEYMREYFDAYTMESPGFPFATHGLSLKRGVIDEAPYKSVVAELHLAPFPANVNQTLELMLRNVSGRRWTAEIIARRRTGDIRSWSSSNQKFLDNMRKQFINWRLLSPTEKEKYYKKTNL